MSLTVVLIKSSKYDADGYLVQFEKGVLPCNSLAAMYRLTETTFTKDSLAQIHCRVLAYDETVRAGRIDVKEIMARSRNGNTRVVVGMVGVQTNMFPRSYDLARAFQKEGATVVIGGFHVSGSITMLHDCKDGIPCPKVMPPECQQLMDEGIVIFHGEAEAIWHQVLSDIYQGTHQLLYRGGQPDISQAPLPEYPEGYFNGFFTGLRTMDTGRGCPFHCSFCSIINVQGNDPRYRNVDAIVSRVKRLCETEGKAHFFFTDDNFARNPYWRKILEGLIKLQEEGLHFSFMVEADLASWRLPNFVPMLAKAGCSQVFMGVESVNQETLKKARKHQNRVETYQEMCELYHRHGMICHAGYIIGFPSDTPKTIPEDIEILKRVGFDHASFFILTPIQGSEDHARAYVSGVPMDSDLNNYDSFQPVTAHPAMTREEWQKTYDNAWKQFYTKEQMVRALKRISPESYWGFLRTQIWYRWSAFCEKTHPMMAGFYRYRRLSDRRPSAPPISPLAHALSEIWRHIRYVGFALHEFFVFEDVYFRTAPQLGTFRRRIMKYRLWFGRVFGLETPRSWFTNFWTRYGRQKWQLLLPHKWGWHLGMLAHVITKIVVTIRFSSALIRATATQSWV